MSIEFIIKILKENWQMFLSGAGMTLFISIIGTIIGTLIGLLIGVVRTIPVPKKGAKSIDSKIKRIFLKIINGILSAYISFFRGTPMMVQAMVIYYGSAQFLGVEINKIAAALFIVSINTGAYMSEIVRGGIVSIDKGQFEAAQAIGMTHTQTMINVVIPQVIRNILPATGNEFVINIKDTAVLNVISVSELFFKTKTVAGNSFRYFEAFSIVCVIYFILTYTVTKILRSIERKLDGPDNYVMMGSQIRVEIPEDILRKKNNNEVA